MKYVFSLVYTIYFAVHAYYTQASYLTGDPLEMWGKIWFISNDMLTMFLAIALGLGVYDNVIRQMAIVGAVYNLVRIVFDICWLSGIANTASLWWTSLFFIIIFIMNFILFTNGRPFKK